MHQEDIMTTSFNCHENRKAARVHEEMKPRRAKPVAIFHICLSLPKYFTKPPACRFSRSKAASSSLKGLESEIKKYQRRTI